MKKGYLQFLATVQPIQNRIMNQMRNKSDPRQLSLILKRHAT